MYALLCVENIMQLISNMYLFSQNLVESSSVILQPVYEPHWQRINGVNGFGADSLLTMMDAYVATLATSQGDTYTTPFEVPTQQVGQCCL